MAHHEQQRKGDARMSQNDKLMEALLAGQTLTPFSALQIAGTLRLSERVRELKREGVPIEKERVQVGDAHVMSYKLGGIPHG